MASHPRSRFTLLGPAVLSVALLVGLSYLSSALTPSRGPLAVGTGTNYVRGPVSEPHPESNPPGYYVVVDSIAQNVVGVSIGSDVCPYTGTAVINESLLPTGGWTTVVPWDPVGHPTEFAGVHPGVTYYLEAFVNASSGSGCPRGPTPIVQFSTPSVPVLTDANVTDSSAQLAWQDGATVGGILSSPGYTLIETAGPSPGPVTTRMTSGCASGNATYATFSGNSTAELCHLAAGTSYTFEVQHPILTDEDTPPSQIAIVNSTSVSFTTAATPATAIPQFPGAGPGSESLLLWVATGSVVVGLGVALTIVLLRGRRATSSRPPKS